MNSIEIEAKIASNLIDLAVDTGVPVPFCKTDIEEVLSSTDLDSEKLNKLRKIKSSVHEVLYAPPRR